ncbi:metal-dependent transcriptional regulator [candidate division KSB1 bacterium]
MDNHKREKEEYLERLWYMKNEEKNSMDLLKNAMGEDFDNEIVDELLSENLVQLIENNSKIILTNEGVDYARQIIRAHRIAERLIYDVLGDEFESGACEFEHIVTPELVDSICILLGHPRECPHGMPIPEGECCKRSAKTVQNSVIPLTELEVGQSARIAYVNSRNDLQLHKMDGLQIRPGVFVKMHQIYPSYVIECEGANIALDEEIVSNIFAWKNSDYFKLSNRDALKVSV